MHRLVIAAAIVVMGCGAEMDDRSRNLDYITEAVLKPNCGGAACHSTFRQAKGLVFDTIEGSRATFQGDEKLLLPSDLSDETLPPQLVVNLTTELANAPRMPYTEPLPDADVALIQRWLEGGAVGACSGAASCLGPYIVPCTDDHAYEVGLIVPMIDTAQVTDCRESGPNMTCRDAACVEVSP